MTDQFCHLLAGQPWVMYVTSPSLSFLNHTVENLRVPTSVGCGQTEGLAHGNSSVNANLYAEGTGLQGVEGWVRPTSASQED